MLSADEQFKKDLATCQALYCAYEQDFNPAHKQAAEQTKIKTKNKSPLKTLRNSAFICAWGVVCFLSVIALMSVIRGDEQVNILGIYTVTIYTDSMDPKIRQGALILNSTQVNVEDIKVGDVITYKMQTVDGETVLITHRVAQIHTDREGNIAFRTKGDNLPQMDNYFVPFENVVGIYRGVSIPVAGFLILFYTSFFGLGTIILYILIIAIFAFIAKKYFPLESDKNKKIDNKRARQYSKTCS